MEGETTSAGIIRQNLSFTYGYSETWDLSSEYIKEE
jgi:hypothetical protein